MKNLTCVTHAGWSGVVAALKTTAEILGIGKCLLFDNSIQNTHRIMTEVQRALPEILLLGGYGSFIDIIIDKLHHRSTIIILWCSNLLQSELTNELGPFQHVLYLLMTHKIHGIAFIEQYSYKTMKMAYPDLSFYYLPCVPIPREVDIKTELEENSFNIDLFCTPDGRKNIYNQIMALKDIATLHVNYEKQPYIDVAKASSNIKNYGRLPQSKLDVYTSSMQLGSQVSFNESYNYVAADHMLMGIPVLASKFVPAVWNLDNDKIKKYLIVENPLSALEIQTKANYLKNNNNLRQELGNICKEETLKDAAKRKEILLENFGKITK